MRIVIQLSTIFKTASYIQCPHFCIQTPNKNMSDIEPGKLWMISRSYITAQHLILGYGSA